MDQNDYISILKTHDQSSYGLLYDAYSGALYGMILRMVKDERAATELLQDTFLKIWINRDKYDPEKARLFTWMNRIAKNLTLNYLDSKQCRNQKRVEGIDDLTLEREGGSGVMVDVIDVNSKLRQLKDKYRTVLELAYFQGYTHQEISDELSMPIGSVKSSIKIGLRELRKIYIDKLEVYSMTTVSFLITILFL